MINAGLYVSLPTCTLSALSLLIIWRGMKTVADKTSPCLIWAHVKEEVRRSREEPHRERLWVHKRISTSIERSQAEPGECWPAGSSQSLSPRREDRAGPEGTRRWTKTRKKITNRVGDKKAARPVKQRNIHQSAKKKNTKPYNPGGKKTQTHTGSINEQMHPLCCYMSCIITIDYWCC